MQCKIAPHFLLHNIYLKFNALQIGIVIATLSTKNAFRKCFKLLEAIMKKFAMMLEDLWVAVAFAEAGIYEAPLSLEQQPRIVEPVRIHTIS
jgi:hypothetical protein